MNLNARLPYAQRHPLRAPMFASQDLTLYRGDALIVLRELPPASVQACLTDPPYGEGIAAWDGPRCREWYVAWLREINRVVVPGGPILSFAPRRRMDVIMTALRESAATSGTTLVAARASGRGAIGVERSGRTCALAIARFQGTTGR